MLNAELQLTNRDMLSFYVFVCTIELSFKILCWGILVCLEKLINCKQLYAVGEGLTTIFNKGPIKKVQNLKRFLSYFFLGFYAERPIRDQRNMGSLLCLGMLFCPWWQMPTHSLGVSRFYT